MNHPKMQYTYVGIDSHKDTHTAVFIDCFFGRLGDITFPNLPSAFGRFLDDAEKYRVEGTSFLFGLEDTGKYGRGLAIFLNGRNYLVKHVNPFLTAQERRSQSSTQKTDRIDAECAARVLLNRFDSLPDAANHDKHWVLRSLVVRRATILKSNTALKNRLHESLAQHYPLYRTYFQNIDCKTSVVFFMKYPSPRLLKGVTVDELAVLLKANSNGLFREAKAAEILGTIEDTEVAFQEMKDLALQSAFRQLQFNQSEMKQLEQLMEQMLKELDCPLVSMVGLDTVSASQLRSCIGDINRFSSPAKLAKYAGVAPVTYASGKGERQYSNQRGNRELNSVFFNLAQRVSMVASAKRVIMNPIFHEYYHRKISEGKTKRQALKCLERRLVNIVWGMLKYGREYKNPER
jgi:transposase